MKKVEMNLQAAFDHLQKDMADLGNTILQVNANALFSISISKLTLRALVDLEIADHESIRSALQGMADDPALPPEARNLFEIYAKSFCADLYTDPDVQPKLRLVTPQSEPKED